MNKDRIVELHKCAFSPVEEGSYEEMYDRLDIKLDAALDLVEYYKKKSEDLEKLTYKYEVRSQDSECMNCGHYPCRCHLD